MRASCGSASTPGEVRDNRRGEVELFGSVAEIASRHAGACRQSSLARRVPNGRTPVAGASILPARAKLRQTMEPAHRAPTASCIRTASSPPLQGGGKKGGGGAVGPDAVVITDGGDFPPLRASRSMRARCSIRAVRLHRHRCAYGIAASLVHPDRTVLVATGDGAFGFNAIEIDTAVRHKAPVLIVVANNGAWQIEVHDPEGYAWKGGGHAAAEAGDHAAMARSFGMHAERVETEDQLGPRSCVHWLTGRRCSTWL